ncbi:MAG: trypsin-like serine protease [Pseudomonadota bacterium]
MAKENEQGEGMIGSLRTSVGVGALAALLFFGVCPTDVRAQTVSPRIVNGLNTEHRPTTGALLRNFGGPLGGICSGILIGCQTFLTAGHCVCPNLAFCTPDPNDFAVYFQHAGIYSVSAVDVEPNFDFAVEGDVAVLTLTSPITGIAPTPINTTATPATNTPGAIVGFGATGGDNDDYGLKREGRVVSTDCPTFPFPIPEPEHICWTFLDPVGKPGSDSNTCFGDSGGPLFMNFGAGDVVAGVTSGGFSRDCLANDLPFDSNVYQYRSFIQSVGEADLSNTSCGAISQVGETGTKIITAGQPDLMDRQTRVCRAEISKQITKYAAAKAAAMQKCMDAVNNGKFPGPCPDAKANSKIEKAEDRLENARLGKKCPDPVIATAGLGGECSGAKDLQGLVACIKTEGDAAVSQMLDVEYADEDPPGPIADTAENKCQKGIIKATSRYTFSRLKALNKCQKNQDKGKGGSCPNDAVDAKSLQAAGKLEKRIERVCGDPQVAALDASDPFGGSCAGVTTAGQLAACQRNDHDVVLEKLFGLVEEFQPSEEIKFEVPEGTEVLRVTLNAFDPAAAFLQNDLDIFLKRGAKPTLVDFNHSSENIGVYEAIEVSSPQSGMWHVLVSNTRGMFIPYQVTVTQFQAE